MRHYTQLTKYALLFVILAVVTLFTAEGTLRLSGHASTVSLHTVSQEDYDRIPGMLEPRQDLVDAPHPRLRYHVTTNALGYRGEEVELAKPRGVVRILALGDSSTFGQFVDDAETLSAILQTDLRRAGFPVQVINAGVPGTTIVDQFEFLQRSMALEPDIVLMTFSENDIEDLSQEVPQHISLERNRRLKSGLITKVLYESVRDTALFNYLLFVRASWKTRAANWAPQSSSVAHASMDGDRKRYEALWKRYSDHLDAVQRFLREKNVRLIFNAYPTHQRIEPLVAMDQNLTAQLDRVVSLSRAKGIETVEILPTFRRSGLKKEDIYLLPYDGHGKVTSYRLQAEALFPVVRAAVERVMDAVSTSSPGSLGQTGTL